MSFLRIKTFLAKNYKQTTLQNIGTHKFKLKLQIQPEVDYVLDLQSTVTFNTSYDKKDNILQNTPWKGQDA